MMSEPEIKNFTWKNIGYWWETYLVVSLWVSWLPKVIFTEWCCRVINAWYVTLRPGQPQEREREREREREIHYSNEWLVSVPINFLMNPFTKTDLWVQNL